MRRRRLSLWHRTVRRLKTGRVEGLKALSLVGGAGTIAIAIVDVMGIMLALPSVLIGGSVIVIAAFGWAIFRGSEALLPTDLFNQPDGRYKIVFSSEDQLREANEWTQYHYGEESVPSEVAIQWRMKNEKAFVAITTQAGELCASFGIIALSEQFRELHIRGDVLDSDIRPSDVLNISSTKKSQYLYISGVIVRDPDAQVGKRRAGVMVWAMLVYLKRVIGLSQDKTLYAIAVSSVSEQILKNAGFQLLCSGNHRKDRCNLYSMVVDHAVVAALLSDVGNFSSSCDVEF